MVAGIERLFGGGSWADCGDDLWVAVYSYLVHPCPDRSGVRSSRAGSGTVGIDSRGDADLLRREPLDREVEGYGLGDVWIVSCAGGCDGGTDRSGLEGTAVSCFCAELCDEDFGL